MAWIKNEKGDWINLNHAESISIWADQGKYKVIIATRCEQFLWKKFSDVESAQKFLDEQMWTIEKNEM